MEAYKPSLVDRPRNECYIYDPLFPCRNISLIGGSSGAGKSTFIAQFIDGWSRGQNVYGYASYPQEFAYISLDRSGESMEETFRRTKVDYAKWLMLVPDDTDRKGTLIAYLQKIVAAFPKPRVFFIEGIASRVPGGKVNDYSVVADYLCGLRNFCLKTNSTIVGVVHRAKTKEGESYNDPREKCLGSVAWAAYTEGLLFIEQISDKQTDSPFRRVMLLPRNAPSRTLKMRFEDGRLLCADETKPSKNADKLRIWIANLPPGDVFSVVTMQRETGVSISGVYQELARAKSSQVIKETSTKGEFLRLPDPTAATDPFHTIALDKPYDISGDADDYDDTVPDPYNS